MEKTFSIMEPCCVEQKLPQLLKKYDLATWQSNGDVIFDKILKSVSYLAGNELKVMVVTPTVSLEMIQVLCWYQRRGWLKELNILTANDQSTQLRPEFPADFSCTIRNHQNVVESLLMIEGEKATVIVQGALLGVVTPGHYQYTTYYGTDSERISMLMASAISLFRISRKKAKKEGSAEPAPVETTEQPTEEVKNETPKDDDHVESPKVVD